MLNVVSQQAHFSSQCDITIVDLLLSLFVARADTKFHAPALSWFIFFYKEITTIATHFQLARHELMAGADPRYIICIIFLFDVILRTYCCKMIEVLSVPRRLMHHRTSSYNRAIH